MKMSPDQPPPSAERPVGYYDKPVSYWQRLPTRSDTGGVVPMLLEGRERFMRDRMRGMTPERRAYRKQWLLDQALTHREPVEVPQLYQELHNPIRRVLIYPFRKLELALKPKYGIHAAYLSKCLAQLIFYSIPTVYICTYIGLHCYNDWSHVAYGYKSFSSKPIVQPDDPNYPFTSTKVHDDYASFGFKFSPFYKTPEQIRAEENKSKY